MSKKSIANIIEALGVTLDEQTLKVVSILQKNKNISENDIAEILGVKINGARKSLYKLADLGFASYSKEKDTEKKWWYMYYWKLELEKIKNIYLDHKKKELAKKKKELVSEKTMAFVCENKCQKLDYNDALDANFTCSECEGVLKELNNKTALVKLVTEIEKLEKSIKTAS
jgi:transcription initiation factor TFIIE subunit alpha